MRVRRLLLTFLSAGAAAFLTASSLSSAPANLEPSQPAPIRAVVELFTSQGCSSCPPADTLLKTLADDPSIMALTLPVDYWNYLGWKDTFASSRNSDRQRSYAKVRGDGSIYTPQVVVNGIQHVNGASKAEIENAIGATSKSLGPDRIPVRFWQENNTLNIATGGAQPGHPVEEATIWFGVVQTSGTVDVTQGENKGKSLTYTNIVRELTPIGLWKGQPMQIQIPRGAVMLAETQKSVVLIQEGRAGPIIGAAWAGLW
ncbi:MAG TPA: DUF1223 domain-containing protein [Hyphomicrobium sp.]|uniref:DUF1223 domain-containing protein n=1 Tax=Hyphomicrobium sp. TaxID=82 RepID=UPI002BD99B2E|nr:DUF1223 domain-containing protein [Hyphomicrobium sp.]HXE02256.1 DUF1223 domain-containing protein [Hyphomicrobium sp.]